jgi:hypothetical protein
MGTAAAAGEGIVIMTRRLLRGRLAVCATALLAATVLTIVPRVGVAAPTASPPSREALAKQLLDNGRTRYATQAVQRALELTAGTAQSPGRAIGGSDRATAKARTAVGGPAALLPRTGLANVRANDPSADRFQVDQTTQSETSIAVAGQQVAVGFNDSQQALPALTDGFDFSGYAYSTDGGRTFTDGGTLPNPLNFVNFGDPWLTSDRAGRMYYATLSFGGNVGNLEIGVARSNDGGKTWSEPRLASPNNDSLFYFGDKEAITAGRDPQVAGRDNLYVAWDDLSIDPAGTASAGLPVATSTDHGATWSMHYIDQIASPPSGCSFAQYIGAQPLVDPADGTLYVAAEKIAVDDPTCNGGTLHLSEVLFKSKDAGTTFGPAVTVSTVTAATPTGALELGPGLFVRTVEFPVMTLHNGRLSMAWNDGAGGRSHIRLATSTNQGNTWSFSWATSGSGDEIQPSLSSDKAGLHLAFYQRNADNTLDTAIADSTDNGIHFSAKAITSRPFPGVRTVPQFDPQIAFGYMGDYISNVSDGTHQYFAWGDNRGRITNFTHPHGRNDPDVFVARR